MVCPKCKGKVVVDNVVHNTDTNEIIRKKKCLACGKRFYTVEFEAEYDERLQNEWYKYIRRHKTNK